MEHYTRNLPKESGKVVTDKAELKAFEGILSTLQMAEDDTEQKIYITERRSEEFQSQKAAFLEALKDRLPGKLIPSLVDGSNEQMQSIANRMQPRIAEQIRVALSFAFYDYFYEVPEIAKVLPYDGRILTKGWLLEYQYDTDVKPLLNHLFGDIAAYFLSEIKSAHLVSQGDRVAIPEILNYKQDLFLRKKYNEHTELDKYFERSFKEVESLFKDIKNTQTIFGLTGSAAREAGGGSASEGAAATESTNEDPEPVTLDLIHCFHDIKSYLEIVRILDERGMLSAGPMLWIDKEAGALSRMALLVIVLQYKGYFKSSLKALTHEQIRTIVYNTFKRDVKVRTIRAIQAERFKEFSFIKKSAPEHA